MTQFGRRQFVASAGSALFCTLAGHKLHAGAHGVDAEQLAADVPVPERVAAHQAAHSPITIPAPGPGGRVREYWIAAVRTPWHIVPTGRDQMMDRPIRARSRFTALAYRPFAAGFRRPLGPPQIPGPLIECETGDVVVIHFRNETRIPVTMHPHGIFYPESMDGAYKGAFTGPGGFIPHGHTFPYVWQARPGTEGAWFYHDHGPLDPLGVYKGLFGPLIVRKPSDPRPDHEFFVAFHSFQPVATGLSTSFSCINGRAYAGNTPTLRARVGETVAWHVYGMDDDFHVFHPHGHRWLDPDGGELVDSKVIGPGHVINAQWTEDNPGRWFYHCHVFSHMTMGMMGWYLVDPA